MQQRQLLDGEPQGTSAERKIVDDLLNGPCVEYRFDAERAAHDRSVIYLTGAVVYLGPRM